ncbi:zinc finger protein 239-like isoform X2 [Daktulosphaira vitifoliae]|uniref:zinc finger protein 239-like isoform X2 n=1 Tax=Daktulosphaira vitifoliae TaxID=58002 RepID=UPI0021AA5695|nr:zinc finger protein 239-like isoform X2 [Daktulosphaira vitifoliae]
MNDTEMLVEHNEDLGSLRECNANDYCRLCANMDERMVPIYVDEGVDHMLENKIKTHLPFLNVQKNDFLPQKICYHCASAILVWDELYESSAEADQKLRSMFEESPEYEQTECKDMQECNLGITSDYKSELTGNDHCLFDDGREVYLDAGTDTTVAEDVASSDPTVDYVQSLRRSRRRLEVHISAECDDEEEEDVDDPASMVPAATLVPKEEYLEDPEANKHGGNEDVENDGDDDDENDEQEEEEEEDCGVDYDSIGGHISVYVGGGVGEDDGGGFDDDDERRRQQQETMCQICATVFKTRYNLLRHFQKRHPEYKMYECDLCRISFPSIEEFKEHLEDKHSRVHTGTGSSAEAAAAAVAAAAVDSKQIRFACDVCGNMYKNKASAMNHLLTHTAKKTVRCPRCEFTCYTKQQLAVHQTKHDKRFVCDICSKRFAQKSQLDVHIKAVHYNQRPYSCVLCNKSFKTKGSHDAHMIVHTDTRNYQCPHCDKKCRKRYDLTLHIRTHTGEKPFKCSVCGRGFVQMCDTRKHEMLHFKPGKRKSLFYTAAATVDTSAVTNAAVSVLDDDE